MVTHHANPYCSHWREFSGTRLLPSAHRVIIAKWYGDTLNIHVTITIVRIRCICISTECVSPLADVVWVNSALTAYIGRGAPGAIDCAVASFQSTGTRAYDEFLIWFSQPYLPRTWLAMCHTLVHHSSSASHKSCKFVHATAHCAARYHKGLGGYSVLHRTGRTITTCAITLSLAYTR